MAQARELVGWPDDTRLVARRLDAPPAPGAYATLALAEAPADGGLRLPLATPVPLEVAPIPGRLIVLYHVDADGSPDPSARAHAVGPAAWWACDLVGPSDARVEGPAAARRFALIDDRVPPTTRRSLRDAALARGLDWRPIDAPRWEFDDARRLRPGDLLYRAAVSQRAAWVQQHVYGPGVATFYAAPAGPFVAQLNPTWRLARAGVPVPETVPLVTTERSALRRLAARLGLPLVLKFPGGEGGVGTVRVDSLAALFSLADHARGAPALASRYLPDATCWRAVVVGDRVVAAYPNEVPADDFRSLAPADPAAWRAPWPLGLAALAVAATHALDLRMGGVDALVAPDGRMWVLEVNHPCYFGHAQDEGGVDVAGAMVDWLLTRVGG